MEYIYSAMVLYAAGKDITEDAIAAILKAAGVEPDAAKIKALTASLEGVNIADAIASASVMAAPAAAAAAPAGAAAAEAPAAKAEEPEEEAVSEEEAAAGLSALFGYADRFGSLKLIKPFTQISFFMSTIPGRRIFCR